MPHSAPWARRAAATVVHTRWQSISVAMIPPFSTWDGAEVKGTTGCRRQSLNRRAGRRLFLRYLAAGPLLSQLVWPLSAGVQTSLEPGPAEDLIQPPGEAINVFDFQRLAQHKLPPAHYGYLATGMEDDATVQANREGFKNFRLRMRRLVDVNRVDLSMELFGTRWQTPIALAPVSSQKAFHPEGEIAAVGAARTRKPLQILSTVSTVSVEAVSQARGADTICIGGPSVWGLAAFGQPGVETVLDLLRTELELVMKQAGTLSFDRITPAFIDR